MEFDVDSVTCTWDSLVDDVKEKFPEDYDVMLENLANEENSESDEQEITFKNFFPEFNTYTIDT